MIYDKLYPFQKKIIDTFASKKSFGLFVDMGLGKTPISLALAERNECEKIMIITLNSKATESEQLDGSFLWWAKKAKLKYKFKTKFDESFENDPTVFIVNYEALYNRSKNKKAKVELKDNIKAFIKTCYKKNVALIVDESHKMKNLQSIQTIAINKIKQEMRLWSNEVYTYLLTGTPFTTGYIDLYSQMKTLGYPDTKQTFVDNFCVRGNLPGLLGWQQPIVGYKNVDMLFDTLHQYAITMKSDAVANLPEQIFFDHITPVGRDFESFMTEKDTVQNINGIITKHKLGSQFKLPPQTAKVNNPFYRNIAYPDLDWLAETTGTMWLRARQLSIGFQGNESNDRWFDERRLEQLKKFLSENPNNYVLFYNFTSELTRLYDICEELGYNIDVYCGPVKSTYFYERYKEQKLEERLVNNKNIILSNFSSGSTGKNWQEYNNMIIFSLPVYKDWEQGLKRIHRLGQQHTTFYHIFYQDNWLDRSMLQSLKDCTDYSVKMFESDLNRVSRMTSI